LNKKKVKPRCFFTGDVPWHHLGRRLDKPATAAEAMEAANLDYTVVKKPLKANHTQPHFADVPSAFATVRTDNQRGIRCCWFSLRTCPEQDAFSFFDPLVGSERTEAIYHTAGVLGRGEKIWLLAKLPDYIRVARKAILSRSSYCFQ